MTVTKKVRQQVEDKIVECLEKAHKHYGQSFAIPTILFTKRGTIAGTAICNQWTVNFNPILLMENQEDFIARTVPHEVAHLIDYIINPHNHKSTIVYGRDNNFRRSKRNVHGADFKFIMEYVLETDDSTRCHNYDTTNSRVKKSTSYNYRCTCGCGTVTTLGAKRHTKEQSRPGTYFLRGHRKAKLELVINSTSKPDTYQKTEHYTLPSHNRSNKDVARDLYATNQSNRSEFIKACVTNGIKSTTASTYFQNFRSGTWR